MTLLTALLLLSFGAMLGWCGRVLVCESNARSYPVDGSYGAPEPPADSGFGGSGEGGGDGHGFAPRRS